MRTVRKREHMKRTQISLAQDELEALRRLASERRVSMSRVVREAIRREMEAQQAQEESLLSIIGLGKGSDPHGAENHDAIYE